MYYQRKKRHKGKRVKKNAVLDGVIGNAPRMKWYRKSYGQSEEKLWKGWEKTIPVRENSLEVSARLACPYEERKPLGSFKLQSDMT